MSEILGSLSLATDLADGQPQGSAMGSALIATRVGQRMGLGSAELTELYWSTLLRFMGCTATAHEIAPAGFGTEQGVNNAFTRSDPYNLDEMRRVLDASLPTDVDPAERRARIEALAQLRDDAYYFVGQHCNQAKALAQRLPVPEGVSTIVSMRHSRWDGMAPLHPSGNDLPLNARIMEFAVAMELHRRAGGLRTMAEVAATRSGGQFDPDVVTAFLVSPEEIAAGSGHGIDFDLFKSVEPGGPISIAQKDIRTVAEAYADFIDIKSTWYLGHSRKVAGLAYRAALNAGAEEDVCDAIFNASLLHDLGKSAIPNGILEKPTPLTRMEEMQLRSFSFHTEQILATSSVFDPLREMACSVEERCDGSGYHRHIHLSERGASLIAVANFYDELTRDLPMREAMSPGDAADVVLAEASAGRFPRDATRHVLENASHGRTLGAAALPDGLTPREADVLRHIAKGLSMKEIAQTLSVSPKTVDNHTQNIYRKIGAKSRATAAIYAMQSGIFST
ncbi:LuxR C-terminal-related transcriptional regulator [Defluviimonas sp. CAU 1641]|uniref:LuxR C-terminal-related transcriptional regulator n=2 Tax=Defluviimonas salinarum TaxID=2992147 RepID=A0ABT3J716_9RHOB|nr:LuxR C-terminal-related transcriptional regulator [Defluviimonas salinarum]